jgi:23S rRNA pseudouridine1911/1915/1917 synthase
MRHRRQKDRARHSPWPRRVREEPAGRLRRRTALEVIDADEAVIVVNKPPGVSLEPGMNEIPSVVEQVVETGAALEGDPLAPAYPVDTDVSGVVVLARTEAAFADLSRQRREGALSVRCLALVGGAPQGESGVIDPHPVSEPHAGHLASRPDDHGPAAVTSWTVRETFVGFALLECTIRPPVPDLIRAHLGSIGTPLAVDVDYGGGAELMLSSFKSGYQRSRRREEQPLIARPSLHVEEVRFNHPTTGAPMTHRGALPKDFRAALHQLGRFGRVP